MLDALRQPLEDGVGAGRPGARRRRTLPARFLLVGASNPCPCGGGAPGACSCDESRRERYLRRLSGPLLDRFDLRVVVARPRVDELLGGIGIGPSGEPSAAVAAGSPPPAPSPSNVRGASTLGSRRLDATAPVTAAAAALLRHELEHDRLSGRGYHRVRRVARTIADLHGAGGSVPDRLDEEHVARRPADARAGRRVGHREGCVSAPLPCPAATSGRRPAG